MIARENPFASRYIDRLAYRWPDWSWEACLDRLDRLNRRAAIVGKPGSGKTTLLDELQCRLTRRGWRVQRLLLTEQHRRLARDVHAAADKHDFILLDGCEQMNWAAWSKFRWQTRRAGGLVVTLHREGRLPVLWRCDTTPALLADLASELLGEPLDAVRSTASELFHAHRGNLRAALREWYDQQSQPLA